MRVTQEEMDRNHERIVAGAARLVREKGIENTSVSDVMREAGLTHGGFYRHFKDKNALVLEAIDWAFKHQVKAMSEWEGSADPGSVLEAYQDTYLSKGHADSPGIGCPIAGMGGDIGRGGEEFKAAFGTGVRRVVEQLSNCFGGTVEERRVAATRELAQLVGAVVIARACDDSTADSILRACKSSKPE